MNDAERQNGSEHHATGRASPVALRAPSEALQTAPARHSPGCESVTYVPGLSVTYLPGCSQSGTVYTPHHLAELVLDLVGYLPNRELNLETCRTLDPACGCGVFLALATKRLAEHLTQRGVDVTKPKGSQRFLAAVVRALAPCEDSF